MLENISWSDYFIGVAIFLALYYLAIGVLYFSGDLKRLFSQKQGLRPKAITNEEPNVAEEDNKRELSPLENTTRNEFAEVEELIERVKELIINASGRETDNTELKQGIHNVLKKYTSLKYSPLRTSVNELIISECQKYGLAALKEEDAEGLWTSGV